MAGEVVGRMVIYGERADDQRRSVPPLALDFSKAKDSSYKSSELRWWWMEGEICDRMEEMSH